MKNEKNEIIIYKSDYGPVLEVRFKNESLWIDAHQMARIFDVNRPAIVKHINNIYKSGELQENSTCSILEQVAADGKLRKMNLYNLDMIISVGYRVNSKKATQFRIWATNVLKKYISDGYAINEKRLFEGEEKFKKLQSTIEFLNKKAKTKMLKGQEKEILGLLTNYSRTLTMLEQFDKSKLKESKSGKSIFILKYENCKSIIRELRAELDNKKETSDLFGNEMSHKLESIVKNLYQTFAKNELYPSLEEKASHLLYLIIKDHPFTDGNKRIGSFLFVYFLDRNKYLYREYGEKKINDNALTALALLVAESNPKEKEQIIALITQLIR
jgi:prophage maintenance system killer protein